VKLAFIMLLLTPVSVKAQALVTITTVNCPSVTVGVPYKCQLQATGGTPPYHWTVSAGTLPTGLTLNDSGLLSGTVPPTVPPQNVKFTVADKEFSLQIKRKTS
jgi:hypothetical protein